MAPTQVSEPGGRSSRSSRTSNPAATLHMLCEAAAAGDAAAVRDLVLLDEVDANGSREEQRTALHLAAAQGHMAVVTVLVEECAADFDAADRRGDRCYAP